MTKTKQRRKKQPQNIHEIRGQLLGWYDIHRRDLPWRAKPNQSADPYHIWLSEIMLQQTTVTAVKAYYTKFLTKWPTIDGLASAPEEEIMAAWAGLGYYARARNLHKCAKIVAVELGGIFPQAESELKKLPGIGDYTAAAITAIAFNKPATVVDGNIERVMARLFNIHEPLPAAKKALKACAHLFFDDYKQRPGDLAQALMDLGAGICIPKAPRCSLCPLSQNCTALEKSAQNDLPRRSAKKPRPPKYGYVYWIENEDGKILFHKRPSKGLLGGMIGLPTGEWAIESNGNQTLEFVSEPTLTGDKITHTFTHFDLELTLKTGKLEKDSPVPHDFFWSKPEKRSQEMPSLFQKAYKIFSTADQ